MKLPVRTLSAVLCAAWIAAGHPAPVAAFDAGLQSPAKSSRTADRVRQDQNRIRAQFFDQNRRRNDLIPLRTGPGEPQLRMRNPRRQSRSQRQEQDAAREAVRRGEILPLGGIIRAVQSQCPGKFLGARLQRGRTGFSYQVRILRPSGQRIGLLVDARTGALIGGRCR